MTNRNNFENDMKEIAKMFYQLFLSISEYEKRVNLGLREIGSRAVYELRLCRKTAKRLDNWSIHMDPQSRKRFL